MDLKEIRVVHAALERRINHELAAINLTFVQALVIQYLYQHEDETTCQKDIQHALGLTHPTVSSILSRLNERGLIQTNIDDTDRRYKAVRLTPQGKELYQGIDTIIGQLEQKVFSGISIEEQTSGSQLFQKMLSNLEA